MAHGRERRCALKIRTRPALRVRRRVVLQDQTNLSGLSAAKLPLGSVFEQDNYTPTSSGPSLKQRYHAGMLLRTSEYLH